MTGPVVVLTAPRSFSSLFAAMLGQHPALFGAPELKLFMTETIGELLAVYAPPNDVHRHGILRLLAHLESGVQSDTAVAQAQRWLEARNDWTTERLLHYITDALAPQQLVDKTPETALSMTALRRAQRIFPNARYLHLTRNPVDVCTSWEEIVRWDRAHSAGINLRQASALQVWNRAHRNILRFAENLPQDAILQVRGEDLIRAPETTLETVLAFLGLSRSAADIAAMRRPERSPFAFLGPAKATYGADPKFLNAPEFRLQPEPETFPDLSHLPPHIRRLAQTLGYM
ncbi:sulfotransferase family protein [Rhodobacter sp. NTK016B]|uniref:sulfotransferase family protein n=1 Tax=Rhodobacter sp. NTK016B TaxID=2759676 RepID=UPI0025710E75|nr:sulfotransferase [Rhodobacter sp. NTK016B]